jgi:hypothetical protein
MGDPEHPDSRTLKNTTEGKEVPGDDRAHTAMGTCRSGSKRPKVLVVVSTHRVGSVASRDRF